MLQEALRAFFAQPAQSSWEKSPNDGSNTCDICCRALTRGMPICRSPHCGRWFHMQRPTELGLDYGSETNQRPCSFLPDDTTGLHHGMALIAPQKSLEARAAFPELLASNPGHAVTDYLIGITHVETETRDYRKAQEHLPVACDAGHPSPRRGHATLLGGHLEGGEMELQTVKVKILSFKPTRTRDHFFRALEEAQLSACLEKAQCPAYQGSVIIVSSSYHGIVHHLVHLRSIQRRFKAISPSGLAIFEPVAQMCSTLFQAYRDHGPLAPTSTPWRSLVKELAKHERRRPELRIMNLQILSIFLGFLGEFHAAARCLKWCPRVVAAVLHTYISLDCKCQELRLPPSFSSELEELQEVDFLMPVHMFIQRLKKSPKEDKQFKILVVKLKGNHKKELMKLDHFAQEHMALEEAPQLRHSGLIGVRRLVPQNVSDEALHNLFQRAMMNPTTSLQEKLSKKCESPYLSTSCVITTSELLPGLEEKFNGAFRGEPDPLYIWPEHPMPVIRVSGLFDLEERQMPLWRDEAAPGGSRIVRLLSP